MGSLFLFFCIALISCIHVESRKRIPSPYTPYILGGINADISDMPYQVSIQLYGTHKCGGAIVASDVIVTAAHCLSLEPSAYTVRVGSSFVQHGGEVYPVADFVKHPGFNFLNWDTDVAVIWLSYEMEFGINVDAIEMENSDEEIPNGELMIVSGWGSIEEEGHTHNELQVVEVPKSSKIYCKEVYGDLFTSNMICAGYDNGAKDSCKGDSGGPLVHDSKLAGIVSWGGGCGKPGLPGVYANVSALRSWIDSTIEQLRLKHA